MSIDLKTVLADGEFLRRLSASPDGVTLDQAGTTTDVVPDAATTPGTLFWNLGAEIGKTGTDLTVRLASQVRLAAATVATNVALPSVTYSNGASGVGATLTATANGALAAIDFVTCAVGDWVLVQNQATAAQNGLYEVTTLGDASNPFVLTRVPCADEAADFAAGIVVLVGEGTVNRGARFWCQDTVTVGTTAVRWRGTRPASTTADMRMGVRRDRRRYFTDFEELSDLTTLTATQLLAGTFQTYYFSGTGSQATQNTAYGTPGYVTLSTGTTTTGLAGMSLGGGAFIFSTSDYLKFGCRIAIPTLSTGTQTFIARFGILGSLVAAPTDGIYFEAASSGGNWFAVTRSGGVETSTDTGVAQGTTAKTLAIYYDEIAATARFYLSGASGMSLVASNTTNLPNGATLATGASIIKSAGTTARTIALDNMGVDHLDNRTNQYMLP